MMLIILAGLQSQPGDVMEAARVDGASAWQTFRYVTLPHLRQYLELAALLGTINIVQTFDAIRLTRGGPGLSTSTLPFRIYQTMFQSYEYGLAAAQGVVVVIFTIIIATFALRVVSSSSPRRSPDEHRHRSRHRFRHDRRHHPRSVAARCAARPTRRSARSPSGRSSPG
ncbi:hypothetical protein GCM10025868_20910 [Angustibacter aerolatus]|uniref:ABC transmembrane type-1 domain-containing protein n=1 Tax=Angustibacter aerolatus TaxID=1162965 RepID=A0ABQ6JJ66_9ACTN|nr:sugar ABC transporter permease [Angustibacter aerolatus]GMA86841.1 hypothetical protein GCM10025868_20910 [Angustibacter aerolatus]